MFPKEIKEAVSALGYNVRWSIIELIQKNEEMAYTELLRTLNIRKGSLTHHLNRLMETGIIDNYSKEEFGGPYSSYYQLSRFGKDLVTGLLSSIQFPLVVKEKRRAPKIVEFRAYTPKKHIGYSGQLPELLAKVSHAKAHSLQTKIKETKEYRPFFRKSEKIRKQAY